jgi:hypothetical protein
MTFASGALRHGVGSGPEGVLDSLSGILMERLPQALRTEIAPSDPGRLPTAFDHRRYPGEAESFINCGPSVSVRAHSCREACRIDSTSARQCGKQVIVLRRATQLRNLVVKGTDSRNSGLHVCREGVEHEYRGANHRLICGQGDGLFESRNAVGDRLLTSGVMLVKAPVASRWPDLLDHLDRRPTAQKSTDKGGADVIKPLSHLRERGFQQCRQPMAEPGAVMDQATSMLHQLLPGSCRGLVWPPRLEMIPMREEPLA